MNPAALPVLESVDTEWDRACAFKNPKIPPTGGRACRTVTLRSRPPYRRSLVCEISCPFTCTLMGTYDESDGLAGSGTAADSIHRHPPGCG